MIRSKTFLTGGIAALALIAFCASANAQHSGSHSGHKEIAAPASDAETTAAAVIHKVDTAAGKINLTHDPIPSIGWPKMTMDLPVTNKVDLSQVKPGDRVTVTLKLGRDKQYRVIAIEPAK